ncbi:hypothetical protein [Actinomadura rudentiformis]|uniref:Uncharacterized protein n=1 Tax=Actinomadura rudentiformis TaxID=359158 RepID=A0A6H9YAI2_9ACTN|nr:hypothetical protein [Actinomadura rudentiformis]KAB2341628.1 hypothetical protein F8566_41600 [Actinomadura rudentiformis]
MPRSANDLHLYDKATDTVRVGRYDLWRLILAFRELTESGGHGWAHMQDWDISFERLADAVDAGNHVPDGRTDPDYRMRCNLNHPYRWPTDAPYNGGAVTTVRVTDGDFGTDHGSHYVPSENLQDPQALCGFSFAPEEARPITGEPRCRECRRELSLAVHLRVQRPVS